MDERMFCFQFCSRYFPGAFHLLQFVHVSGIFWHGCTFSGPFRQHMPEKLRYRSQSAQKASFFVVQNLSDPLFFQNSDGNI